MNSKITIHDIDPERIRRYAAKHAPLKRRIPCPASHREMAEKILIRDGTTDYLKVAAEIDIPANDASTAMSRLVRSGRAIVVKCGKTGFNGWPTVYGLPKGKKAYRQPVEKIIDSASSPKH